MHGQGQARGPSKPAGPMPATDDEIREKYLERAIRELNQLTHEVQGCRHCPRGDLMPVLGSGHPQADILLLKHAPVPSEVEEGVAFYGRSGTALMKSLKRLSIDPLAVRVSYAYTVTGRNVGQSNTLSLGLVYRFHLFGRPTP